MEAEAIAQKAVAYGRKPENADGISIHLISNEIKQYANEAINAYKKRLKAEIAKLPNRPANYSSIDKGKVFQIIESTN